MLSKVLSHSMAGVSCVVGINVEAGVHTGQTSDREMRSGYARVDW